MSTQYIHDTHTARFAAIDKRTPAPENGVSQLIRSLRRRKVFRAAMTYTVITWLILQIADVSFPLLDFPDWTLKLVVRLLILGFPITVIVAWIFQVTPHGVVVDKRDADDFDTDGRSELTVNLSLLLFGAMLVLVMLFAVDAREFGDDPQVVISVTEVPQSGEYGHPIVGELADELRRVLVETTDIRPLSAGYEGAGSPAAAPLTLWVNIYDQVRVVAFLLDPNGSGSHRLLGAFELANDPPETTGTATANRIVAELQKVVPQHERESLWRNLFAYNGEASAGGDRDRRARSAR